MHVIPNISEKPIAFVELKIAAKSNASVGWTQQIAAAKLIERPDLAREIARPHAINAITPMQSIAAVMQERGERYRERMADVSEKVADHLESSPQA